MNEYEVKREHKKRHQGLSRFKLKVISMILLAFQPIGTAIVPRMFGMKTFTDILASGELTPMTYAVICEAISWVNVPIFAWLLYTGYLHTKRVRTYAIRLAILAVVTEVPYDWATYGKPFTMQSASPVLGLLIALGVLYLLDWASDFGGAARVIPQIIFIIIGLLLNNYFRVGQITQIFNIGVVTLGFIVIFYYLNRHENTMMYTAGLLGAVMIIVPAIGVAILHYRNDELGYSKPWVKWVFYALYPVMLLVCAGIGAAM